jgi:hypothetical protein
LQGDTCGKVRYKPREEIAMDERRDYRRRAESFCSVMLRLLEAKQGIGAAEFSHGRGLAPGAAERILKRLVFRGFARRVEDRWLPTAVLIGSYGTLKFSD